MEMTEIISAILVPLVGIITRTLSNRRVLEHQKEAAEMREKYNDSLETISELRETCATCMHRPEEVN